MLTRMKGFGFAAYGAGVVGAALFAVPWLPHLIFIPVAIIVYLQCISLFLRVSGLMIHDGPAGDASALGGLYLLLALLVHLSAFATAAMASVNGQARGS